MNRIVRREKLSKEVVRLTVEAPLIAKARKAGQFVIVQKGGDMNERIPLTIADADPDEGTIKLVFQAVGEGTHILAHMMEGDSIENILGPLGNPTDIRKYGKVVCVAGGVGVAPLYPIAKAMKDAGNDVRVIIGARNRNLILELAEMKSIDNALIVMTDDGTMGRQGVVTEPLQELCADWKPDLIVAIGPTMMMKFCWLTAKPYGIKTIVSLNSLMLDGTGMCGGCRISYGGQTRYVCVDGPEFDAALVDWNVLQSRQKTYRRFEEEHHHRCHWELAIDEGEC